MIPWTILQQAKGQTYDTANTPVVHVIRTGVDNLKGSVTPDEAKEVLYCRFTEDNEVGEEGQGDERVSLIRYALAFPADTVISPEDELIIGADITFAEDGSYVSHSGGKLLEIETVSDVDDSRSEVYVYAVYYHRRAAA